MIHLHEHHETRGIAELRRLAKRAGPRFERAFLRAVGVVINGTVQTAIADALAKGNIELAVDAVPWESLGSPVIERDLVGAFVQTFRSAGLVTVKTLPDKFPFSVVDDRPLNFLRQYGADKVVDFGLENRTALRTSLTQMMRQGVPPTNAATRIMPQVGLTEQWAAAVDNRYDSLIESGVDEARALKESERYAKELRRLRATNIARTEPAIAVNSGYHEAHLQAADRGVIDRQKAKRIWHWSGVSREGHAQMEGQAVGLEDPFVTPGGARLMYPNDPNGPPGEIINCACYIEVRADG